jgi:glycosyltransferase involved in cell wall biosynthesis
VGDALRIGVDGRVMQDRYHGIGRHTYELVNRLAARECELVIVHDPSRQGRLDVARFAAHPRVRLVELRLPVVSPLAPAALARVLWAERPDVFLAPYHLAAPLLHPRVPTLTFIHDCIIESDPVFRPGGRLFGAAYTLATRLAIARTSAIATISEATRTELERRYRIRVGDDAVIPHGVGEDFLEQPEPPTAAARFRAPHRYVLHVGVHRPHKNHAVLIEAFARVARDVPDVRLVLVGQRDERFPVGVDELVGGHGVADRVDLLENVDNAQLLDLYRNASAFAFPSLMEGFGLPVLEAMASGVPAVISDDPATVEAGSGAALVVPRRDVAAWAEALRTVLTEEQVVDDMVTRGRKVAHENTWDRAADRTLALLRRVSRGQR